MVVTPSGDNPNYFRRYVRLVQYLALRLLARFYFQGGSEILSPTVARVFSVDQIEHFCIPLWGSCVRRQSGALRPVGAGFREPSRVKTWCDF